MHGDRRRDRHSGSAWLRRVLGVLRGACRSAGFCRGGLCSAEPL